jgi:hypothetical protein
MKYNERSHDICLMNDRGDHFCVGKLDINNKGQYIINDHILSEGEIVSIFHDGQFIETSIHFASQVLYSAIGLPIELGQIIKYEPDR